MGCECYRIGGPFIAEDPSCPAHGHGGLQDEVNELQDEISRLKDALQDAIMFMKDAKKVSIKSRGMQLEAQFFGRLNDQ